MCDTVVRVTTDGVLFAKNSDRDANECQSLAWYPAGADEPVVRATHLEITGVERRHAVLLSQPWWIFGAEMGLNDAGVVIGNEAVYTTEPDAESGLLGMDLVRLALERADSAHHAVSVLVALLEQYGQGGACAYDRPDFRYHNSFLIADAGSAFVLETAGRHWATEEVTGPARAISNGLTIPAFAARFARTAKGRVIGCELRRQLTQSRAADADAVVSLFDLLRSHGASVTPTWTPLHGSLGAPCVHVGGVVASSQTTASLVVDLRDGVRAYATGTAAPCTSVFKSVSVDEPVNVGGLGSDRLDDDVLWWRHERLHRRLLREPMTLVGEFRDARDALERSLLVRAAPSADAFAAVAQFDEEWCERLGEWPRDQRPRYVADRARRLDERAGFKSPGGP